MKKAKFYYRSLDLDGAVEEKKIMALINHIKSNQQTKSYFHKRNGNELIFKFTSELAADQFIGALEVLFKLRQVETKRIEN